MSTASFGSRLVALSGGGLAVGFVCYSVFSVADVSVKAIGPHLSAFEVTFFLTVFSALVLPLARRRDERWSDLLTMQRPALTLFRSVASTFAGLFSTLAFTHIPFAEAYAVIFIAPVLALVLSVVVLAEQVGWRRWTSVAAGIVGVLIVLRPGFRDVAPGHFAALASSLCIAGSIVCLRVMGASERPSTIYAWVTLVSLLATGPVMLVQGFVMPSPSDWGLLLLSGLAAGAGQLLLMAATRRAPANQIAPLQYSQLGWAILYGALFFAELPDAAVIAGLVFIVASGLFLIQRKPRDAVAMPGPL